MKKKWYRSRKDKMIGGVAGGLAEYFEVDPTIVRILFVVGLFLGAGFLAYILLWIIVPEEPVGTESASQNTANPETTDTGTENNSEKATRTEVRKNRTNIFGALLVILGVLLLIDNFVRFHAFWPLLLILIGVGILLKTRSDQN